MVHCLNFVLACMTSSRHSEDHISLNRKCTVVILYQLCFGLSQKCKVVVQAKYYIDIVQTLAKNTPLVLWEMIII